MKKIIPIFFMCLALLCFLKVEAYADSMDLENVKSISKESTGVVVSGSNAIEYSTTSISPVFNSVQSTLSDSGNGYLKAYASTQAYSIVQQIGFTVFFQVWNGSQWTSIDSISSSAYDSSYIGEYQFKAVSLGKYYRAYVRHFIVDNDITYFAYSTSNTVYIK